MALAYRGLSALRLSLPVPPLAGSDEIYHSHRADQIARGDLLPSWVNGQLGGDVTLSVFRFSIAQFVWFRGTPEPRTLSQTRDAR